MRTIYSDVANVAKAKPPSGRGSKSYVARSIAQMDLAEHQLLTFPTVRADLERVTHSGRFAVLAGDESYTQPMLVFVVISEGATIGAYRVVRKLGEGGMGVVYVAEHALLGRRAAIKVLLPEFSANKEIVQRFFNEAKATTQIADPGIVQIFDFGYHTDGSAFIVMEILEGEPLSKRLARVGRFAPIEIRSAGWL